MARETIVKLFDDISGGDADMTVSFAYRGHSYEIDLSDKNAKAFDRDMEKYISHARKAGRGGGVSSSARRSAARDYDLASLRAWAVKNGHQVPARGRIRQSVLDSYKAAGGR